MWGNQESREQELERQISRDRRALNNPYEQDKWIERERIEENERELERLRNNR